MTLRRLISTESGPPCKTMSTSRKTCFFEKNFSKSNHCAPCVLTMWSKTAAAHSSSATSATSEANSVTSGKGMSFRSVLPSPFHSNARSGGS